MIRATKENYKMPRELEQEASSRQGSGKVHEKGIIPKRSKRSKRSKRMHKTWENLGAGEKQAGLAFQGKTFFFFF